MGESGGERGIEGKRETGSTISSSINYSLERPITGRSLLTPSSPSVTESQQTRYTSSIASLLPVSIMTA